MNIETHIIFLYFFNQLVKKDGNFCRWQNHENYTKNQREPFSEILRKNPNVRNSRPTVWIRSNTVITTAPISWPNYWNLTQPFDPKVDEQVYT